MLGIGFSETAGTVGFKGALLGPPSARTWLEPGAFLSGAAGDDGMVHVIDRDGEALLVMRGWLAEAGLGLRVYRSAEDFLDAAPEEGAGCVMIDVEHAQTAAEDTCGLLQRLARRHPVIVAGQADVATAVRTMKAGACDFVEKPYREMDVIGSLRAAVALDGERRRADARHDALRARFETLSRRERQVMALVTTGLLNKQVGGRLGLSEITVKAHRGAMMRKIGAATLAELVRMADSIGEACQSWAVV
jgi:FixJ family two-component response regulator